MEDSANIQLTQVPIGISLLLEKELEIMRKPENGVGLQ